MNPKFCYLCGGKLSESVNPPWTCYDCAQEYFDNPKPCVEVCLFNQKGQVLISKRGIEPYKGKYDLPGGFVNGDETAENAIVREIAEELQLSESDYSRPTMILSYTAEYPFGNEVQTVFVIEFVATLNSKTEPKADDDVESIKWVKPETVKGDSLAVPEQAMAVKKAVEYINEKGGNNA